MWPRLIGRSSKSAATSMDGCGWTTGACFSGSRTRPDTARPRRCSPLWRSCFFIMAASSIQRRGNHGGGEQRFPQYFRRALVHDRDVCRARSGERTGDRSGSWPSAAARDAGERVARSRCLCRAAAWLARALRVFGDGDRTAAGRRISCSIPTGSMALRRSEPGPGPGNACPSCLRRAPLSASEFLAGSCQRIAPEEKVASAG